MSGLSCVKKAINEDLKVNVLNLFQYTVLQKESIDYILSLDNYDYDACLAKNSRIDPSVINILYEKYKNIQDPILFYIAKNPITPENVLYDIVNLEQTDVPVVKKYASLVAENPNTSPDLLNILADYEDCFNHVKQLVARHNNTSSETLDKLSYSNNRWVRSDVMNNKNISNTTLERLKS
jgi:hypothetical protein